MQACKFTKQYCQRNAFHARLQKVNLDLPVKEGGSNSL